MFPSVREVHMEAMVRRKDEGEKDRKMEEGGQEQRGKWSKEGVIRNKRLAKEGEGDRQQEKQRDCSQSQWYQGMAQNYSKIKG